MANTVQLLRRIKTAENVSKTTRALQMISASKLKLAQSSALSSRPYVTKLSRITHALTPKISMELRPEYMRIPEKGGKTLVIVISPDKGLCGSLISNLTRSLIRNYSSKDVFITVGRKMESYVSHLGEELIAAFPFGTTLPSFNVVYPILDLVDNLFLSKKVERVEILSSHFVNIFTQVTVTTTLLPVYSFTEESEEKENMYEEFEPTPESILPALLKRYVEMSLYQEIVEAYLAEQSARMISMQNATNNAKEIIEDLRLEYNKTRQAKITSEILDISSPLPSGNV